MPTPSSPRMKLTDWLRTNTAGTMLMQWISYFMIFSVLLIFILEYPVNAKLDWHFYGAVLILAVLLLANILWFQTHSQILQRFFKRHNLLYHWIFCVVTTLLVLGAFALTGSGEIIFLLFMQAAQFAGVFGVWPMGFIYSVVSLGIAMGILKAYRVSDAQLIQIAAQFMAGIIFVLFSTFMEKRSSIERRRAEHLLRDLQAAHLELQAAQQKEKDLAIAEERMRLARDIHDGLGHHLTVLSIQLQAADKLVERNPQAAAEAIRTSRQEAQAALDEVRRSVGMMREPAVPVQPLVESLDGLVRDFGEHTGLTCRFETTGQPVELPAFVGQTLFRTVQESLTNARKHGQAVEHIFVKLEYQADCVHLEIRDDGRQPVEAAGVPAGYGLKGLKERIDQLGGTFFSGPGSPAGFQVEATVPYQEARGDQTPAG